MRKRKAVSSLVSPKVRFFNFNTELFVQVFPGNPESVGAIDASFISKSGRKTEGLGWYCNGCAGTSQRGIEVSMISITNLKSNTAYALDAQQTIDEEGRSRVEYMPNMQPGSPQYFLALAFNPLLQTPTIARRNLFHQLS